MAETRTYAFKSLYKRWTAGLLDAAGHFFFNQQRPLPSLAQVKRLLIVRLDHLGDVICILPLIHEINRIKPKPYVAVCVSSAGALLLRDTPGIDECIIFDAPWFSRTSPSKRSAPSYRDLIRRLRSEHFDMSLELKGDFRHHLLLWWSKIPYRLGYGFTGGAFLLTHELESHLGIPPIESNLAFLKAFGIPLDSNGAATLTWNIRNEELEWLKTTIPGDDFVVFHVDAGTPAKRWPINRYIPLIQEVRRSGSFAVLVGSNPALSFDLPSNNGDPKTIDLLGRTTLPQLVTLIAHSRSIVSTDSGPAHIAAALEKPTFILWSGTSDPAIWKPRGPHVFHVQAHVPCEYCANEVCPLPEQICMTHLTPGDALPVMKEMLSI